VGGREWLIYWGGHTQDPAEQAPVRHCVFGGSALSFVPHFSVEVAFVALSLITMEPTYLFSAASAVLRIIIEVFRTATRASIRSGTGTFCVASQVGILGRKHSTSPWSSPDLIVTVLSTVVTLASAVSIAVGVGVTFTVVFVVAGVTLLQAGVVLMHPQAVFTTLAACLRRLDHLAAAAALFCGTGLASGERLRSGAGEP